MNSVLAPLRHIHRELYLFGWGIVPAVLAKFRMECLLAIACLCLGAVILEMVQRRWFSVAVWIASWGLLCAGMRADRMLWGTEDGAILGGAAIALAAFGVGVALIYRMKQALREARRERRRYRRVPGMRGAVPEPSPKRTGLKARGGIEGFVPARRLEWEQPGRRNVGSAVGVLTMNGSCCTPKPAREPGTARERAAPTLDPRPGAVPETAGQDMVSLPGGTFLMGTDYERAFAADGEGPVRRVTVAPFRIDRYPVTNAAFAAFVRATGYRTESEVFGWSFCFWMQLPPDKLDELVEDTVAAAPWWCVVRGADWAHPEGPRSDVFADANERSNHPVVHVSWNDAAAYAAWAGKQLPTEAQWEYAARGGLVQRLYPWGDELTPADPATGRLRHRCNIWQGEFPGVNTAEDGFRFTCPVDAYPPNGFGIYSITGNAWEWCSDWFSTAFPAEATTNPAGPSNGEAKAMRGGSFLCHESYCNRYRVAARTSNTPDSSASNVGFRCVDSRFANE